MLLALATIAAALLQRKLETDIEAVTAPGRMVHLPDGRRLHLVCRGHGSPVILLEAGMAGWHSDWAAVLEPLARSGRVCAYDRAGYGWSDPMPAAGTWEPHRDLAQLRVAAGLLAPAVLVGHSLGGLIVADHAREQPSAVAALVWLDAVHRRQADADHAAVREGRYASQRRQLTRLTQWSAWLAPTGWPRLAGLGSSLVAERLAGDPRARQHALAWAFHRRSAVTLHAENAGFDALLTRSLALGPLPRVPALVLSSTEARDFPPGMEDDLIQSMWHQRQSQLAAQAGTVARPLLGSGHYPHVDRPQAVIAAVDRLREQLRSRSRW